MPNTHLFCLNYCGIRQKSSIIGRKISIYLLCDKKWIDIHVFAYKERPEKLLTPEVVNQLVKVHELKDIMALILPLILTGETYV